MDSVASCSDAGRSQTETLTTVDEPTDALPVLRLRLERPRNQRHVVWREGTVDNENMGKKKSKCCCIYKKPLQFGESSSEDDEECENCFGHPEKKRKNQKSEHSPDTGSPNANSSPDDACDIKVSNATGENSQTIDDTSGITKDPAE